MTKYIWNIRYNWNTQYRPFYYMVTVSSTTIWVDTYLTPLPLFKLIQVQYMNINHISKLWMFIAKAYSDKIKQARRVSFDTKSVRNREILIYISPLSFYIWCNQIWIKMEMFRQESVWQSGRSCHIISYQTGGSQGCCLVIVQQKKQTNWQTWSCCYFNELLITFIQSVFGNKLSKGGVCFSLIVYQTGEFKEFGLVLLKYCLCNT